MLVAGANEPSRGFASGDLPLGPDSLPLRPGRGAWTRAVSPLEADVSACGTSGPRGQGPHRAGGTCWRHGDTLGVHGQTAPLPQRTAAVGAWEGRGGAWTEGGGPHARARSCLFPLSPWEADLAGSGGAGGGQGFRGRLTHACTARAVVEHGPRESAALSACGAGVASTEVTAPDGRAPPGASHGQCGWMSRVSQARGESRVQGPRSGQRGLPSRPCGGRLSCQVGSPIPSEGDPMWGVARPPLGSQLGGLP